METYNGDSSTAYTDKQSYVLKALLPGRNYSITVQAVSNKIESNETFIFQATSECYELNFLKKNQSIDD